MDNVSITFDDGPNGRYTRGVLDVLERYGVKASFFLLGINVEYYPEIAKRIKKEGHLIASHSYSHKHLNLLKPADVLNEIEKAEQVYKKVLNLTPKFFRPPYGQFNRTVKSIAEKKGYKLVGWDVCADDWKKPSPEMIARRIVSQAKDGSVILLHDGANIRHGESRINTVKALPKIIETLEGRGVSFMRLDQAEGAGKGK